MRRPRLSRPFRTVMILACTALAGACASMSPVQRRAAAISDADADAKRALAGESQIDPAKIPARTIAVLPFSVASRDTLLRPLGYGLAELLVSDLAVSSALRPVERAQVGAIMRELSLVDEGIADPRGAPRVGRLLGARRIVIGSATATGNNVTLSVRVVDAIAGTVQELLTASAPLDRVWEAEKDLALRVFAELGVTLTPAQRATVERRQTTNLAAIVAFGRGAEAEARGDAAAATLNYTEAVRLDAAFATARVSVASAAPSAVQRSTSIQRVVDLSNQVINAPITTKLPEAVDVPVQALLISMVITLRLF